MADEAWQRWFDEAWKFREETLYRKLFGSLGPGIYPLNGELFTGAFRQDSFDPRWLTHGVFECAPTRETPNWIYVSSGLSNAWEASSPDPNAWSGLGCEFILQSSNQARWALTLLRRMIAFQILLAHNRLPGKPPLGIWDRIPLRAPIDGASSQLSWALVAPSPNFGDVQQIPSGRFRFFQLVGITEDEAEYARGGGSEELFRLLLSQNATAATDPGRQSVIPSRKAN